MSRRRLDRNILVISDLHLGEDVRPAATSVSYLRRIVRLERELESFLAHYARVRVDGRPWRLVVNGDMVDFMSVVVLPQPGQEGAATEEERQFGLAYAERQTLEKLDRVIERHQGVFRRLAEFVAAGHELVVVVGNHDVEFHYPAVQRRFVDRLREMVPALPPARIRFCPWFYYEEELVYVEHGHQYDEYCSFDYQLHPVETGGHVALSVAHAGIRYFTNMVPTLEPSVGESWDLVDYLKWAWAQGVRSVARIFYWYGLMCWKLIELWLRLTDRRADQVRHERHREALRALANDYRLAVEKVEALDGLRSMPVARRLGKILRAMFLDRFVLAVVVILGLVLTVLLSSGWERVAGSAGLLGAAVAANYLLGRGRLIPSRLALRRTPEFIGRILRAPFVVFGHSHRAEAVKLPGGVVYFNTGSWVGDDLRHAFTHLIISGEEPRAELRQWRNGASTPFPPEPATG